MNELLQMIGRDRPLFAEDLALHGPTLADQVAASSFLVIGGAGSIGQAVVKEIFRRQPRRLHVVDLSENNMVELVRDLRSSYGYIEGEFKTFALDVGSLEFTALMEQTGGYDYILNLSALKHVRSEKDPFTLMRMVDVNILNTETVRRWGVRQGAKKYFCVSTDKATNPANMMGASKRIMEMFLFAGSDEQPVSTARFANVAFSDGSLLHGFTQRIAKRQPFSAPRDVRRYFITAEESGVLCLASCLLGENRDIFFPKLDQTVNLITFADIAVRYLRSVGYEPEVCASEDEARRKARENRNDRRWPCYFFDSDTTGEKDLEEFYTPESTLDMGRYPSIGVIRNPPYPDRAKLDDFLNHIAALKAKRHWTKRELVDLFRERVPEFRHQETGKYLDDKM